MSPAPLPPPPPPAHDAPPPPTAFPATARAVRAALAGAPLDARSLAVPLRPCALERCGGTCCAVGVTLNEEEALVVAQLARRHADALAALVPDLPTPPVVTDADGTTRTAVRPRPMHGRLPGYPAHFPDTACAFLTADARCALQVLAGSRGAHPWSWKPLACWLHPLALAPDRIALPAPADDPYPGGFASVTPCGRALAEAPDDAPGTPSGAPPGGPDRRALDLTAAAPPAPAHVVLAPELAHLGLWLGRDLAAEAQPRAPDAGLA